MLKRKTGAMQILDYTHKYLSGHELGLRLDQLTHRDLR